MKFLKMASLILAVCLLCGAMISCGGDKEAETEISAPDNSVTNMTIKLVVKGTDYAGDVTFSGYLGDAIETFTIMNTEGDSVEAQCFDSNDILVTVCDITATADQSWIAYFEADGKDEGAIDHIRSQSLKDKPNGCTVILELN